MSAVGNVNLPTPVVVVAGALLLLAGYILGVVAGPDGADNETAVVASYSSAGSRLCLTGDGIGDRATTEDGELCGRWLRADGSRTPREGDEFRFVTSTSEPGSDEQGVVYIYGDVVDGG